MLGPFDPRRCGLSFVEMNVGRRSGAGTARLPIGHVAVGQRSIEVGSALRSAHSIIMHVACGLVLIMYRLCLLCVFAII